MGQMRHQIWMGHTSRGSDGNGIFFRWQCRPDEFYVGVHAKMYAQSKGLELFDTVSAFRVMRCATFGFQTQLEYW